MDARITDTGGLRVIEHILLNNPATLHGFMQENHRVAKPVFPIRNTDLGKRPIKYQKSASPAVFACIA